MDKTNAMDRAVVDAIKSMKQDVNRLRDINGELGRFNELYAQQAVDLQKDRWRMLDALENLATATSVMMTTMESIDHRLRVIADKME
jgi:hypothetical protein